jgi:hypothetical protein
MHVHHPHHHHHPHDHDHHHHHHPHAHGHNRSGAAQWQVPHRPEGGAEAPSDPEARDLDLVEASFVEGFLGASDPTSFLRLAHIPFSAVDGRGRTLRLLRCEIEDVTDVGAVMPLMGGAAMRYDPLPKAFVSRRRRLALVYHDGFGLARLAFAEARALKATEAGAPLSLGPSRP